MDARERSTGGTRQGGTREARGGLRWDFGAWFGSQLGSSLWMLLVALLLLARAPLAASLVLAVFALVNATGALLWTRRERLRAHAAMQVQLWVSSAGSVACLYVLARLGGFEKLPGAGPVSAHRWALIVLAMTVFLSLLFWRQDRAAARASRGGMDVDG